MIYSIIYAFMATLCFAIIFHVNKKNILLAAFGGAIGISTYEVLTYHNLNIYMSILLAAIALSLYSEIMARIRKTTVTTFTVSAMIPLVPGSGMYQTMMSIVTKEYTAAFQRGIFTISCAGLLAFGILLVSTFAKLIKK